MAMDVERIINEIEQLEELFEAPDIRPLTASDVAAANPWFRLWNDFGICCRSEASEYRLGDIKT
jgi:hypothetical protein